MAQNNMLAPLQNMPMPSMPAQYQQQTARQRYPNAQYPRAREWWEGAKQQGGKAIKGALGGAVVGAGVGKYFPTAIGMPLGAAIGAAGGGAIGLLDKENNVGNAAFGTPEGVEQYQNHTPEQQNILQLLQQLGIQGLQNPYGGFDSIAEQEANQFHQQTVPSLAERFTSLGNASLSSPLFATQLSQAGQGFHTDLAAQKAQYGQQNIQQALQMLQMGLNPQFENIFRPAQSGFIPNAANFGANYALKRYIKQLMDDKK